MIGNANSEPNIVRVEPVDVAYEAELRAMPSYELKAEYIVQFGNTWDQLERPRLEHAIEALLRRRAP